jgi:hypothetical protein
VCWRYFTAFSSAAAPNAIAAAMNPIKIRIMPPDVV